MEIEYIYKKIKDNLINIEFKNWTKESIHFLVSIFEFKKYDSLYDLNLLLLNDYINWQKKSDISTRNRKKNNNIYNLDKLMNIYCIINENIYYGEYCNYITILMDSKLRKRYKSCNIKQSDGDEAIPESLDWSQSHESNQVNPPHLVEEDDLDDIYDISNIIYGVIMLLLFILCGFINIFYTRFNCATCDFVSRAQLDSGRANAMKEFNQVTYDLRNPTTRVSGFQPSDVRLTSPSHGWNPTSQAPPDSGKLASDKSPSISHIQHMDGIRKYFLLGIDQTHLLNNSIGMNIELAPPGSDFFDSRLRSPTQVTCDLRLPHLVDLPSVIAKESILNKLFNIIIKKFMCSSKILEWIYSMINKTWDNHSPETKSHIESFNNSTLENAMKETLDKGIQSDSSSKDFILQHLLNIEEMFKSTMQESTMQESNEIPMKPMTHVSGCDISRILHEIIGSI